jgi:phosphoribosyl-AMP cyclohydrolase
MRQAGRELLLHPRHFRHPWRSPCAESAYNFAASRTREASMADEFAARTSVEQVEEGAELAPKFDADGLIPAVTTDAATGELLMVGYMNAEALKRTIETGEAHYWSRSRKILWHKGATSGLVQKVVELMIDDDQDCVWLKVGVAGSGASCHVGYRTCFYRRIPLGRGSKRLEFTEKEKVFEPKVVYGDAPNPTKL